MILFHVQHLLGAGHVQRVRMIAGELAARGVPVAVASGGSPVAAPPPAGVDWHQLEPLRAGSTDFDSLVGEDGRPADEAIFARRAASLRGLCARLRPRVVVVESYPFGRRAFRAEIDALLASAREQAPAVVVVCSVRDIVHRRRDDRQRETAARIRDDFDAVLVHGDPDVIGLDASFDAAPAIADRIVYTGYVAPAPVPRHPVGPDGGGDVVVSAGNGAAGLKLFEAAIDAARAGRVARPVRLLVGAGLDEDSFEALARRADGSARIERNRPDFREILAGAAALVSQAGYNTLADILVTGVPSVLVPFEGSGETEQLQRARRFEALGRCAVLPEGELSGETLAARIAAVLAAPEPVAPAIDLDGVAASADWLESRLGAGSLPRRRT